MLTGHDHAWQEWREAMASPRMHHAWILAGQQGIGKGSFAREAAAQLVAEPGVPQPAIAAHPDIHLLDHLPDNDDEAKKRDEGLPYKVKRNISVDQIRRMQLRLNTRPTLGSRRVIIIDPADDMEKGAVNALLKSLEEPPVGTYFLLVAHRPGRLLPTIRSRCRSLRFAPLADAAVDAILRKDAPEANAETRAAAVAAAQGSPGVALGFVGVATVVGLFAWIVLRAFGIAKEAIENERYFAALLAQGLGVWIGVQGTNNIGVNMGLLPTKGLTLPLLSFGGSGILANCIGMAILLRIDFENRRLQKGLPV